MLCQDSLPQLVGILVLRAHSCLSCWKFPSIVSYCFIQACPLSQGDPEPNWLILVYQGSALLPQFRTSLKGHAGPRVTLRICRVFRFTTGQLLSLPKSASFITLHVYSLKHSPTNLLHITLHFRKFSFLCFQETQSKSVEFCFYFFCFYLKYSTFYLHFIFPYSAYHSNSLKSFWLLLFLSTIFAIFPCFVSLANLIRMLPMSSCKSLMKMQKGIEMRLNYCEKLPEPPSKLICIH